MATEKGNDIILTLMADVAALREGQEETSENLEKVAENLASLVAISRKQTDRLGRVAELLQTLASAVTDHEARISALEARE